MEAERANSMTSRGPRIDNVKTFQKSVTTLITSPGETAS